MLNLLHCHMAFRCGVSWQAQQSPEVKQGDSPQLMFSIFQPHAKDLYQRGRSWLTWPLLCLWMWSSFAFIRTRAVTQKAGTNDWEESTPGQLGLHLQGKEAICFSALKYITLTQLLSQELSFGHCGKHITVLNDSSYLGWFCRKV